MFLTKSQVNTLKEGLLKNENILCTGGYDPLHSRHISYFKSAKELGDYLIVGLNSDNKNL